MLLEGKSYSNGKTFVLAYANIYMAMWEVTVFPKCSKLPLQYFRCRVVSNSRSRTMPWDGTSPCTTVTVFNRFAVNIVVSCTSDKQKIPWGLVSQTTGIISERKRKHLLTLFATFCTIVWRTYSFRGLNITRTGQHRSGYGQKDPGWKDWELCILMDLTDP